jgi:hypothetical protein
MVGGQIRHNVIFDLSFYFILVRRIAGWATYAVHVPHLNVRIANLYTFKVHLTFLNQTFSALVLMLCCVAIRYLTLLTLLCTFESKQQDQ